MPFGTVGGFHLISIEDEVKFLYFKNPGEVSGTKKKNFGPLLQRIQVVDI